MSDIRDVHPMSEFRVRAISLGLNFSWIVVGVLVVEGIRVQVLSEPPAQAATIGVAAMLAALNLIKWDSAINSVAGRVLLWLWAAAMLSALGAALSIPELAPVTQGLYFALIVFVAVIGRTRPLMWVTFVVMASILLIPLLQGHDRTAGSLVVPAIGVAAVAIITRMLTVALASSLSTVAFQETELARNEANFERLYEVSRTIAAGDSLDNVLPELVGRIATYLDSEVGVVLLRDDIGVNLDVISPIWAAGHSLEIAGYRISLQSGDPLAEAFVTQQSTIINGISDQPDEHGLMGELGLDTALVVTLKVDRKALGLMVLGDKIDREFTESDLRDLESLAAPAALVLAQLDRYQEAAETGRRMEELARMKTDFVSVVSHELRTPLTSIIGALATLNRPELSPEKQAARELLASARNQTDRLRRLIEDLLMASRIENGALPQHPVAIELSEFIASVIDQIPDAGQRIGVEIHERVAKIEADADHLQRVLINLVENAMKYASGSPVEISAGPTGGGKLTISVIDHGPGINDLQRAAVFDRFTQLEPSATRSHGGTGLGLHIVKGLVDSMGGEIELAETPGGGATFHVVLPRAPGSVPRQAIRVLN